MILIFVLIQKSTKMRILSQPHLNPNALSALVVDDTVKVRRGKNMEGVSRHYDHTSGRCVMGQQVVQLGLVSEEHFLPLDNQLYISSKEITGLKKEHEDGRSIVARLWRQGLEMTKPQMVEDMLKRVLGKGFRAPYLVADSWYSSKKIMNLAMQNEMCAVLRMKKGNTKYRVQVGTDKKQLLHAKDIYSKCVRKNWHKLPGRSWQVFSLKVELKLQSDPKQDPNWHPVQLLFVRALKENGAAGSRRDWALFLSTDDQLSPEKLLQIYSLRWSVEVYFKEAKQNLGFLAE